MKTIVIDGKSLFIGFLFAMVMVLLTSAAFMKQTIDTQVKLSIKEQEMIRLYDKYLEDNRLMLTVILKGQDNLSEGRSYYTFNK